jgi:hypothetical protein
MRTDKPTALKEKCKSINFEVMIVVGFLGIFEKAVLSSVYWTRKNSLHEKIVYRDFCLNVNRLEFLFNVHCIAVLYFEIRLMVLLTVNFHFDLKKRHWR